MTPDWTAKVIASLRAFATQIGVNWFWSEWDEAGHFELTDTNDHIDDVSLSGWSRSGARALASAFHALPAKVRRTREVRLAAAGLDELALESFWKTVRQARKNRKRLPKKIRLEHLRVFDGARDRSVRWVKELRPSFAKDEPTTTQRRAVPKTLFEFPLSKRHEVEVHDRLYEELLDVLGAPSSVKRLEAACDPFFPSWKAARVEATVHPVGMAVRWLSIRAR